MDEVLIVNEKISFLYLNHRGKIGTRKVIYDGVRYGTSEWHKEPQWLLKGIDIDRNQIREFAMKDMKNVVGLN